MKRGISRHQIVTQIEKVLSDNYKEIMQTIRKNNLSTPIL